MPTFIDNIRNDFLNREDSLKMFELFSGTGTAGEDGVPDPTDPDTGLSVTDSLAIGSFASLGLTGLSYGMMKYSENNPVSSALGPMKVLGEKIKIANALEAAQEGKTMTKLMELLPNIGTGVKRLNIDALWEEVNDALKLLDPLVTQAEAAGKAADTSMETLHSYSQKAFVGFTAVTGLGVAATALTAAFHDRAVPLVDDYMADSKGLQKMALGYAEDAFAEFDVRSKNALEELDTRLADIEDLTELLPDSDDILDLVAQADALLAPITSITAVLDTLVDPYEGFLDVANVIGAPIEGIFTIFENPPKVLPIIVGYETITPGFWLTVPDPTWSNPLRTKKVWVPPVTVPIPGFKEIFSPVAREDVQEIIDLILGLANLPMELLETALAPILGPIESVIQSIMQPIIDALNPFSDYIDDFTDINDVLANLSANLAALIEQIEATVAALEAIDLDFAPIDEIGALADEGMATYFGTDAAEELVGAAPTEDGGFMNGALLYGNGGHDSLTGTDLDDMLSGGAGRDDIIGGKGNDLLLGGTGHDKLSGGADRDILIGGAGNDKLWGDSGKDQLYGGNGDDTLSGGRGNDKLIGGQGEDALYGDDGDDKLSGGRDNDILNGGLGDDGLTGGKGEDVFVFSTKGGTDTVYDFEDGVDMLQIKGASFADLTIEQDGSDTMISVEDLTIVLKTTDAGDLTVADFI
ncbi:calcium-binding protein [Algirhabdus cladophorae]|uniref:calcium-binding protein n=1 Tax=Algirhabdus cladophorae TaxID=3377108 RepID=UPI003B849351